MTLEEAAEKVLLAARQAAYISANRVAGLEDKTDELMEALKSYGDQRFIEGATAALAFVSGKLDELQDAARVHPAMVDYVNAFRDVQNVIDRTDPNQLKDTDHG